MSLHGYMELLISNTWTTDAEMHEGCKQNVRPGFVFLQFA